MAKEYIERDAVLDALYDNEYTTLCPLDEVSSVIDAIPAADVAEVVRCAECEHWGGVTFGNVCRRWSFPHLGSKNCTKPNDFCSYGERRDNNAD